MTRLALIVALLAFGLRAHAQTTQSDEDSAALYQQAAKQVQELATQSHITSPSNSDQAFDHYYAPYPADWLAMEKTAFAADEPIRQLVHRGLMLKPGDWSDPESPRLLRTLANDVLDAAMYQDAQGDDASAVQSVQDIMHLAEQMPMQHPMWEHFMFFGGLWAMASYQMTIISSDVQLTDDPANTHALSTKQARKVIDQVLEKNTMEHFESAWQHLLGEGNNSAGHAQAQATYRRMTFDRNVAGISLAIHLYRFDHKSWPGKLDDVAAYMPRLPMDPWDQTKPTGYVLIKRGLPDESDRPLVYSVADAKEALAYRSDEPQYSGYRSPDGKEHGIFFDVARWSVPHNGISTPTTEPLQENAP